MNNAGSACTIIQSVVIVYYVMHVGLCRVSRRACQNLSIAAMQYDPHPN